jgi:hypothetical protein
MRRIATLAFVALAVAGAPASASAVTNTVKLTARMQMLFAPSASAPAPLAYELSSDVDTNPGAEQPESTGAAELFFARQIESNARYFPTCTMAQVDGATDVPAACRDAIVGNGYSVAHAGQPGQPLANSVREEMSVTLLNGSPAGQQWIIYLQSLPSAPVYVRRAIAGSVQPGVDPFGFSVRFDIPYDLQFQLGLHIALTKLVLNIPSEVHAVNVDGATYNASFLRIGSCDGALPALERVDFNGDGGYPGVTFPLGSEFSSATVPCEIGPGFAYYPPNYPPGTYPGFPPLPVGSTSTGGGGGGTAGGSSAGGSSPLSTGTGSGGGQPPPPPPGPPRIAGPASTRAVTVSSGGAFTLPGVTVACPANGGDCTVDALASQATGASARRVLAKVHFRLRAGRSSAVRLKLNKRGRKLLARKRSLRLVVRLTVREASGPRVTRTIKTKLRAKKAKRA